MCRKTLVTYVIHCHTSSRLFNTGFTGHLFWATSATSAQPQKLEEFSAPHGSQAHWRATRTTAARRAAACLRGQEKGHSRAFQFQVLRVFRVKLWWTFLHCVWNLCLGCSKCCGFLIQIVFHPSRRSSKKTSACNCRIQAWQFFSRKGGRVWKTTMEWPTKTPQGDLAQLRQGLRLPFEQVPFRKPKSSCQSTARSPIHLCQGS